MHRTLQALLKNYAICKTVAAMVEISNDVLLKLNDELFYQKLVVARKIMKRMRKSIDWFQSQQPRAAHVREQLRNMGSNIEAEITFKRNKIILKEEAIEFGKQVQHELRDEWNRITEECFEEDFDEEWERIEVLNPAKKKHSSESGRRACLALITELAQSIYPTFSVRRVVDDFKKYLSGPDTDLVEMSPGAVQSFWTEKYSPELRYVVLSILSIPTGNALSESGFSEMKELNFNSKRKHAGPEWWNITAFMYLNRPPKDAIRVRARHDEEE